MATAKPTKGAVFSLFEKRKKEEPSSTPDPLPIVIDGTSNAAGSAQVKGNDHVKSEKKLQPVFSIFKKQDKSKPEMQAGNT
jgi:hypothetical protein